MEPVCFTNPVCKTYCANKSSLFLFIFSILFFSSSCFSFLYCTTSLLQFSAYSSFFFSCNAFSFSLYLICASRTLRIWNVIFIYLYSLYTTAIKSHKITWASHVAYMKKWMNGETRNVLKIVWKVIGKREFWRSCVDGLLKCILED